jgi:hypothetical protein
MQDPGVRTRNDRPLRAHGLLPARDEADVDVAAAGAPRRWVLLLPAEPKVDLRDFVRRAREDQAELLVLSLGDRPTPAQRDLVGRALDLGVELRLPVEARLVLTGKEATKLAERARKVCLAHA